MIQSTQTVSHDITICSVFHSAHALAQLERNFDCVAALNPGVPVRWLAADNSPGGFPRAHRLGRFEMYPGAGAENFGFRAGWASMRHATALAKLFPRAAGRFLLVLDPDFYIVRQNWIREVLDHMRQNNLAFFGSIWHPRYYTKYRYFPTTHCFFVDLEKVPAGELNFMPGAPEEKRAKPWYAKLPRPLRRPLLALTFQDRKFIGDSRDTGWTMYERFARRRDFGWECVQAAYRPWRDLAFPQNIFYWPNRALEFFLPDRLCFVPKKRGYYSTAGFRELGYPDVAGSSAGWEEYLWRGQPFGLHLRGTKAGYHGVAAGDRSAEDFTRVKGFLDWFARVDRAPARPEHNL